MYLDVTQELKEYSYPMAVDELASECCDKEVTLMNGTECLGDVFERPDVETCNSVEEARELFYLAVGEEAIGRKHYSDRDPQLVDEGRTQLSI